MDCGVVVSARVTLVSIDLNLRVALEDGLGDAELVVGCVDAEDGLRVRAVVLDQAASVQLVAADLVSVLHD